MTFSDFKLTFTFLSSPFAYFAFGNNRVNVKRQGIKTNKNPYTPKQPKQIKICRKTVLRIKRNFVFWVLWRRKRILSFMMWFCKGRHVTWWQEATSYLTPDETNWMTGWLDEWVTVGVGQWDVRTVGLYFLPLLQAFSEWWPPKLPVFMEAQWPGHHRWSKSFYSPPKNMLQRMIATTDGPV